MHPNNRELIWPLRIRLFSKCSVRGTSRFTDNVAAVGGERFVFKRSTFQEFLKTSFMFINSPRKQKQNNF